MFRNPRLSLLGTLLLVVSLLGGTLSVVSAAPVVDGITETYSFGGSVRAVCLQQDSQIVGVGSHIERLTRDSSGSFSILAKSQSLGGVVSKLRCEGAYIYAVTGSGGFHILRSDNLALLGSYQSSQTADYTDLEIYQGKVILANAEAYYGGQPEAIDVSDPTSPTFVSNLPWEGHSGVRSLFFDAYSGYLLLGGTDGVLQVLNGGEILHTRYGGGRVHSMTSLGGVIYVGRDGLIERFTLNVDSLTLDKTHYVPGRVVGLAIANNKLILAQNNGPYASSVGEVALDKFGNDSPALPLPRYDFLRGDPEALQVSSSGALYVANGIRGMLLVSADFDQEVATYTPATNVTGLDVRQDMYVGVAGSSGYYLVNPPEVYESRVLPWWDVPGQLPRGPLEFAKGFTAVTLYNPVTPGHDEVAILNGDFQITQTLTPSHPVEVLASYGDTLYVGGSRYNAGGYPPGYGPYMTVYADFFQPTTVKIGQYSSESIVKFVPAGDRVLVGLTTEIQVRSAATLELHYTWSVPFGYRISDFAQVEDQLYVAGYNNGSLLGKLWVLKDNGTTSFALLGEKDFDWALTHVAAVNSTAVWVFQSPDQLILLDGANPGSIQERSRVRASELAKEMLALTETGAGRAPQEQLYLALGDAGLLVYEAPYKELPQGQNRLYLPVLRR